MIKGLGHPAFNVTDMDKSMHFYSDVLGFKFLFQLKDDQGKPWINYLKVADMQFVELFYGGTKTATTDSRTEIGFNHLCLEVEDIKAAIKELEDKGVVLDKPLKQGSDLNWQTWIRDPDGNRIELMQFHPDAPQMKG